MNKTTDLKTIERQAYLSYHQDGLIDLFVGGALFSIALLIWLLPESWFFLIGSLVVMSSLYAAVKKKITVPRMGYVEFSSVRRQKTQYIFLVFVMILVFANILTIIAWLFPSLGVLIFESMFTILLIGLIGGGLLLFIGSISDIKRFHAYSILFLGSAVFTFFIPVLAVLPLISLGIVMMIYGSSLLYRFVKQFPKESLGEMDSA